MYNKKHQLTYHLLLLPGLLFILVFSIIPMFGIVMAFQKYMPSKGIFGSEFVGLKNFRNLLMFKDVYQVIANTIIIAVWKIVLSIIVPIFFAILLNELKYNRLKRAIQTVVYLPHFLSWVVIAVIMQNIFSYTGVLNTITSLFGAEPKMWLVSNTSFRPIIIISDTWKNYGYNAIIYLAAITGIDPSLYESADIDGANRMQKIYYITLPSLKPTIILMATLSLGSILNAGFEQIFALYTPLVYETGDIIDTYVYRMGLERLQYSMSTAVGLAKSMVSAILIISSYWLADRFAGYTIF